MPFYLLSRSDKEFKMQEESVSRALIDGAEAGDLNSVFQQMAEAFQFPGWFGENLDALYDALTDLDWLSSQTIILEIDNAVALCSSNQEDREKFTSLLKKVLTYYDHDLKNFIVIAEPSFLKKINP